MLPFTIYFGIVFKSFTHSHPILMKIIVQLKGRNSQNARERNFWAFTNTFKQLPSLNTLLVLNSGSFKCEAIFGTFLYAELCENNFPHHWFSWKFFFCYFFRILCLIAKYFSCEFYQNLNPFVKWGRDENHITNLKLDQKNQYNFWDVEKQSLRKIKRRNCLAIIKITRKNQFCKHKTQSSTKDFKSLSLQNIPQTVRIFFL